LLGGPDSSGPDIFKAARTLMGHVRNFNLGIAGNEGKSNS
jgi:hypothetical protein